jgi:hypothetical protein
MLKRAAVAVTLLLMVVSLYGCYSFQGSSINSHLKTIAIPVFEERSGAGIAQFRGEFTRGVAGRIESQGGLQVIPSIAGADALLEGTVISFSDDPGQLSGKTERAITNRIMLAVQVRMSECATKKTIFLQSFTGFADYPVGSYVAREDAIRYAIAQIVDSIVDRVVSGW